MPSRKRATLAALMVCAAAACVQAQDRPWRNLRFNELAVGSYGVPVMIDVRVVSVLSPSSMLVGMEDARTGDGKYLKLAVLSGVDARNVCDDDFFRSWETFTGGPRVMVEVKGTVRAELPNGASKTVLKIQPIQKK